MTALQIPTQDHIGLVITTHRLGGNDPEQTCLRAFETDGRKADG